MFSKQDKTIFPLGSNEISANLAGQVALTAKPFVIDDGVVVVVVGVPVYSTNNVFACIGAFSNYSKNIPSNFGVGVLSGLNFKI
jgi:hypothetical protein